MPLDFVPMTADTPASTPAMGKPAQPRLEIKGENARPSKEWVEANPDAALAYVFAAQEDDGVIAEVLAL